MLKFKAIPTKVVSHAAFGGEELKPPKLLNTKFPYKVGDRVAQMWLEVVTPFEFEEVSELDDTDRGEGGFGSTGV